MSLAEVEFWRIQLLEAIERARAFPRFSPERRLLMKEVRRLRRAHKWSMKDRW